jgi:uncharacterized protein (TIGR02996 family)
MTERDALLRAVCESPDDDTPRLVFADWLQENGEEARAEFIRLQCEFQSPHGNAGGSPAEYPARFHRMIELRDRNRVKWLAELPTFGRRGEIVWQNFFHRGFVARLDVFDLSLLDHHVRQLMTATPVSHLGMWLRNVVDGTPAIGRLATTSELKGVRFISIDLSFGDGNRLALELDELERTHLYRCISVLFRLPLGIPRSMVTRIKQLGLVAARYGQRVECL